jgi:hypothetical protein
VSREYDKSKYLYLTTNMTKLAVHILLVSLLVVVADAYSPSKYFTRPIPTMLDIEWLHRREAKESESDRVVTVTIVGLQPCNDDAELFPE